MAENKANQKDNENKSGPKRVTLTDNPEKADRWGEELDQRKNKPGEFVWVPGGPSNKPQSSN